jgi:hypothetical protein
MNNSIFKISSDMQMIINHIMENGGEITPDVENQLMIKQDELRTKSISYANVIRAMEYETKTIDAEIKRLQDLKRVRTNTVDRLKTALSTSMQVCGLELIEDATTKINFRKSTSLEIIDETKVPNEFKTQVITTKVDKNAIKAKIKQGDTIDGVELIENQNIQIK